jgi:hypothetical protein
MRDVIMRCDAQTAAARITGQKYCWYCNNCCGEFMQNETKNEGPLVPMQT